MPSPDTLLEIICNYRLDIGDLLYRSYVYTLYVIPIQPNGFLYVLPIKTILFGAIGWIGCEKLAHDNMV